MNRRKTGRPPVPAHFEQRALIGKPELVPYERSNLYYEDIGPCNAYLLNGQLFLVPQDLGIYGQHAVNTICRLLGISPFDIHQIKRAIIHPANLSILEHPDCNCALRIRPEDIVPDLSISLLLGFYGKHIPEPADLES